MAEQIPLGFVLENLKELILYCAKLISGLDEKVNTLVEDLETMKAYATEFTKKDTENALLLKLAKKVRKMVEDAEDTIEDYIILQANKKGSSRLASKTVHIFDFLSSNHKDLLKRIEKLSADAKYFIEKDAPTGLKVMRAEAEAEAAAAAATTAAAIGGKNTKRKKVIKNKIKKWRQEVICSFHPKERKKAQKVAEEDDDVVGFEDEAEKVIKLLTGEAKELEIISIIGMLGLGKTTLAKKVLKDPKVEKEFFYSVFVNVSRKYEKREVFINILRALKCKIDRDMVDEDEIIEKLNEELGKNKYLIVLDDVWDKAAWDDLKDGFPDNNKGSRVLITSRDIRVASHENSSKRNHKLRFMTNDESQELLRTKVFGKNECPHHHLVRYEERILKICGGLPLAIIDVAAILRNQKESTEGWDKVAKSVCEIVAREDSQIYNMIKSSLKHFPYHQRACFLYLGVFREGFEIPVWKLLRLWIAEGFVKKEGCMTLDCLEDKAEEYLQGLVDRSLVIVVSRRSNGQIKTCRIHDTLRGFCKIEATKQNLFQEIKMADRSTYLLKHHRRICVNLSVQKYLALKLTGARVRSFLTFAKDKSVLRADLVSSIPKAFRHLRVLDAKPLIFPSFPAKLGNLVLLKYIAMSIDSKEIPRSFSNLINLQTVVIDTTYRTLEIKADISKLTLLRHLQTNAATSLEKGKAIEANPNLQTLCTISPESCTQELLETYPNLKKLGIRGSLAIIILDKGEFSFFETLAKQESLENLKLVNDGTSHLHILPRETSFPRTLRRLTLMSTFLDWENISTLGKLQQLEVLKLKDNAFDGDFWNTEGGGFRCLKVLHIVNIPALVSWKADASHFPMLTSLYLRHCVNLTTIPHGIGDIPSLQTIDVIRCKPSVVSSAQKIRDHKSAQAQQKNKNKFQFKLSVYPPANQ